MDYEVGLGTVSTSKNIYILEVNATDTSNPDQVRHLIYLTIENVVEELDDSTCPSPLGAELLRKIK